MNPRAMKFCVVGLGALALSCTGVRVPVIPGDLGELSQDVGKTFSQTSESRAECEKLNALPTDEEEYALGGAIALNWVQQGGGLLPLSKNEKLVRYVNTVGKNLGAQSSRPALKWTFGILETEDSFNALSAPGGYVFVTLGLLEGVENEAQLAGVLAHEIAHVTGRHVLKRYTETKVSVCKNAALVSGATNIGKEFISPPASGLAENLRNIGKSGGGPLDLDHHPDLLDGLTDQVVNVVDKVGLGEEEEFAADEEAVRLLVSAGYDPQEYLDFIAKLPDRTSSFANHPKKVDRRKRLVAFIRAGQDSKGQFPEFAAGTDGLVQPPLPPEFSSLKGTATRGKP